MRIGSFASKNHVTVDTIRHYLDLGLLLPDKSGAQYEFDEPCQSDLERILALKDMGFSLQDIKSIFYYKRLAQLTSYQEEDFFIRIFENKTAELSEKILHLTRQKENLDQTIADLMKKETHTTSVIGFDIHALPLLCCPHCKGELTLAEGTLKRNQVIEGTLLCNCGQQYQIKEGIVFGENTKTYQQAFDLGYLDDYIKDTNANYLDQLSKGMENYRKKIDFQDFQGKVILELGSGLGFFLRAIFDELPDDTFYLAIDHDPGRHRFLKQCLESIGSTKKILFLCSDFLNLPIKEGVVDILCDLTGTSNYSFEHADFLLDSMLPYLKKEHMLIASYILFSNFMPNSDIETALRNNFTEKHIRQKLLCYSYHFLEEYRTDLVEKGGKYEDYFKAGEKVYTYAVIAKRLG